MPIARLMSLSLGLALAACVVGHPSSRTGRYAVQFDGQPLPKACDAFQRYTFTPGKVAVGPSTPQRTSRGGPTTEDLVATEETVGQLVLMGTTHHAGPTDAYVAMPIRYVLMAQADGRLVGTVAEADGTPQGVTLVPESQLAACP